MVYSVAENTDICRRLVVRNPVFAYMKTKQGKTAITITPLTVGRHSADKVPDFSSLFFRRPIKNITTVLFFSSVDSFFRFWQSADDRPIRLPMSYLIEPQIIGRCVGQRSTNYRPTTDRLKGNRPTINRLYSFVTD